jgi:putative nucleotidyltransferase with HDIG domain
MSSDRAVLLISDRPDRSRELAHRLDGLCACQTIGLGEQESIAGPVAAILTDIAFRQLANVEHLRRLLSQARASGAPIVAILRDDSHLERVQAAALGATSLLTDNALLGDIVAALGPAIRPSTRRSAPTRNVTVKQNVEHAKRQLGSIFAAAANGELVPRTSVDNAAAAVMAAIAEGGIRRWLEVVWTYDDATYQHCLLVAGLAAEFASSLRFATNDQKYVIRGAVLHDLGKSKIPLAILNKPTPLTSEEAAVLRTHAGIGYELLRRQPHYEPELLEVVLRHHELLDGSGYPDGIAGTQINDLVRLVTICDIYAALIERRSYKPAIEPARAFKMLQEMEGKLEGALVRAFAKVTEKSAAPAWQDRLAFAQ